MLEAKIIRIVSEEQNSSYVSVSVIFCYIIASVV